ncbi:MAG: DUF5063 domain-containing protein [Clostridium sp.]|nr:DUF5063 domain-containing protein [Prevotella sp.]MCM1428645.1 DUF5063 domain-containing protein [Clostridium sp.]MCM1475774.1 DUF5063 domain-containing protein [Muribaculaceae bacterium]
MSQDYLRSRLIGITAVASEFCLALENARESSREDFLIAVSSTLPKIYLEFADLVPESPQHSDEDLIPLEEESPQYFPSYVDEVYYDSIRRGVEALLGPDDVFLETFEEDMKYSDTPIAASVSECLADIFQPLYNFISVVRDSQGDSIMEAYMQCREDFVAYWSQTLCNVMRPINNLRFGH